MHLRALIGTPCAMAILGLVAATPATALTLVDVGQGDVNVPGTNQAGLSGIARQAGDQYYVVEDSATSLTWPVQIPVDPVTGFIGSVSTGTPLSLAGGDDLEELSFHPSGDVFASDETGPAIRRHAISDGSIVASVAIPPIYQNIRPNQGFESVEVGQGGSGLWTVNEAALTVDGPVSTSSTGMWLRLQRFDASFVADGQWAYEAEPIPGNGFTAINQLGIGVTDIEILPDGTLLTMERNMGGVAVNDLYFEISIFAVDLAGATDTTNLGSLVGASFTPVSKTLLWQEDVGLVNFEGMTLGPELANGDLSLLLLAEGGTPNTSGEPVLRALRLSSAPVPEPGSGALVGVGLLALARRRRARK